MAVGDVALTYESVANNASTTGSRPGSSVEWIIHTIHAPLGSAIEVYITDATNATKVHDFPNGGAQHGLMWAVTHDYYITIKNVSGSTVYVGMNGKITK